MGNLLANSALRRKRKRMTTRLPRPTHASSKLVCTTVCTFFSHSHAVEGMAYEKKAKKNAYDAVDEHTRYITLLSTIGPEITQEK